MERTRLQEAGTNRSSFSLTLQAEHAKAAELHRTITDRANTIILRICSQPIVLYASFSNFIVQPSDARYTYVRTYIACATLNSPKYALMVSMVYEAHVQSVGMVCIIYIVECSNVQVVHRALMSCEIEEKEQLAHLDTEEHQIYVLCMQYIRQ